MTILATIPLLCITSFFVSSCMGNTSKCPPADVLRPHCWCLDSFYGGALFCENIFNPTDLAAPVEACQKHKVTALGLFNSSLLYIPRDIFKGTQFVKITFINTHLMSLSNGPLAFEGLENTMEELRATSTQYTTLWRFSQLKDLKEMQLIDINNIHMESINEKLPFLPKLTAFGLLKAAISHLDDEAFANCPKLQVLDLRSNSLFEMKRSMLPNPAEKLYTLNLQDNELESLPSDFFENMPVLQDVFLNNNKFFTLDEATFALPLSKVQGFGLTGNPLRCDCRLQWIVGKIHPYDFDAVCASPESLKGRKLKYIDWKELYCFLNQQDE